MSTSTPHDGALFAGPSEMASRCADLDWSLTPLGAVDGWTQSLRTTASILLRSRFPMCLSWGPDLVLLYNDAFIATLGAKHPAALGARIADVFAEIWDDVGHQQWSVLDGGESVYEEDRPLVLERGTGPEETFYTFCYSHVPDDPSRGHGPGGVLSTVNDTTRAVVGARRMALLNALATGATGADDRASAAAVSVAVLAEAVGDLDHGACFLPDGDGGLELAAHFGEGPAWPSTTSSAALASYDGGEHLRVVLPLRTGSEAPGVLVLAPHPLRPLDDEHRRFLHLVAEHVGQSLTLASARADEQRRLASLAAADAAKSTFLASMSHEFRTPLTLLLGPLEEALAGARPLDDDDLATMHQSTHRLLRMVNALLEVTRVDAEPRPPSREPVDVARLSEDLLRPFAAAAARAGLALRVETDPAIGAVEVDPALWGTIVVNLAANALKYTLQGHVVVRLGTDGRDLVLAVTDTGIGIAPDEQGRVFDRFYRVPGPSGRTIEGTGLGLALVADAVRAHGGEVSLASAPGEGTELVVRVPLVVATAPVEVGATDLRAATALAGDVAPHAGTATAVTGGPEKPSIVVVDDNLGMRQLLSRALGDLGQVVTCADGAEALEVLGRQRVDLVVTDVVMPRLDGIGLVEAIRADDRLSRTPVVLLSARAGPDAATEALGAGADDYVVKPFTRDELVARCRTTIELASMRAGRAADDARTAMLADLSHDMQTPISVVTAVLAMLADDDLDADQRRDLVARGSWRAEQLEQLVSELLDWSQLSTGRDLAAQLEPVDVVDLVRDVATRHDVRLEIEPSTAHEVLCDRVRTERILHHVLVNARSAAREVVTVEVEAVADAVEVHVDDDGPGIAVGDLPRLFSAYTAGGPARGGLGLHVARESARAQGGDLALTATGPAGNRFVLRLVSVA